MEILRQVNDERVRKIIETQGNHAEHNFYHYMNVGAMYDSCVFPIIEGKYGIMGFQDKDEYWCYTDPLAPKEKRLEVFLQFVDWAFSQGAKKIRSELGEELWKEVVKSLKNHRVIKPSFVYFCPVYDLKTWNLTGTRMKNLRNCKNAVEKNHKVEVVEKDQVSRKDVRDLFERWKKTRQAKDRARLEHYFSAADNNFLGYDAIRFIIIDGTVRAVNGGWKIPNSQGFYSQLGLHDYSIKYLGEYIFLEDLLFLKGNGFAFADFGGSGEELLAFKKKFFPARIYKDMEFSIV